MSALVLNSNFNVIETHPSFLGCISGLKAEKLLRGKNKPYMYVLRQGECIGAYYVTFVHPDGFVKHTPFELVHTPQGWFCENGGSFEFNECIDEVIHKVMHCEQNECQPLSTFCC